MIAADVVMGRGVTLYHPEQVNLYGCEIGDGCRIGAFVEIRRRAKLGRNVKVQAFAFIPEGVTLGDGCFVGPHVCFTNDPYPRSTTSEGRPMGSDDWEIVPTVVREGASLGANCTVLCGLSIGRHAIVGAGAVVTRNVPDYAIVAGVPAQVIGDVRKKGV